MGGEGVGWEEWDSQSSALWDPDQTRGFFIGISFITATEPSSSIWGLIPLGGETYLAVAAQCMQNISQQLFLALEQPCAPCSGLGCNGCLYHERTTLPKFTLLSPAVSAGVDVSDIYIRNTKLKSH